MSLIKKQSFLLVALLCLPLLLLAQDKYEDTIIGQYKKMQKLEQELKEMNPEEIDYEQLVTYAYPGFVKMVGGKEAYKKLLQSAMAYDDDYDEEEDNWEADEYGVQSTAFKYVIGPVYKSGNELQAVVEVQEIEEFTNRYDIYKTYDLVISQDEGKTWYIIEAEMSPVNFVPELNENIILPEETEETKFKDEDN